MLDEAVAISLIERDGRAERDGRGAPLSAAERR
jgi:hypothetical protein